MTDPSADHDASGDATEGATEDDPSMAFRGRLVRPVAILWGVAAVGLVLSEVVRLVDVGELGWQLLVGALAGLLAWRLWHAGCRLDQHGLEITDVRGHRRILWSTLDAVQVDVATWFAVPVRARRRDGSLVAIDGTWGMRRGQRQVLVERLQAWARPHGVDVEVVPS